MGNDVSVPSFAAAFGAAVESRSVSLTWVQRRLRDRGLSVSLAALSYWRSGSRVPNLDVQRDAIVEIEAMLEMEPGTLVALAVRPRDPEPETASGMRFASEVEALGILEYFREAERVLEAPWNGQFREVSLLNTVDVAADGYPGASRLELVFQCLHGVMTRVMYGAVSPGGAAEQYEIEVIDGGRILERYISPDRRLIAISIELDRPLAAGETALVSGRLGLGKRQSSSRSIAIGVHRQTRKVMNWVRFHPEAVPDWIQEVVVADGQETRTTRGLDTGNAVHQLRWDFGPGSLGLDWGFGEPEISDRK